MKKQINQYSMEINNGSIKGYFNIYQAKNGKMNLLMGNNYTELSLKQINDLGLDIYSLVDFDYDDFKKAYSI